VIVVTPYIVRPVDSPSAIKLPTDGYSPPDDLQRLLLLRQVGSAGTALPGHLPADTGFIVQ
jgi:pilus assembly protein CpaC